MHEMLVTIALCNVNNSVEAESINLYIIIKLKELEMTRGALKVLALSTLGDTYR